MHEFELKCVVEDPQRCADTMRHGGGVLAARGRLVDWRWDTADGGLAARDEVLRLRVFTDDRGGVRASLDWKGPTRQQDRYKVREEISTPVGDPEAMARMLERLGYRAVHAIDREIETWEIAGAHARLEWYPSMDVLLEIEGTPEAIERAIAATGIERERFTSERLADFAARYAARTGRPAVLARPGRTDG